MLNKVFQPRRKRTRTSKGAEATDKKRTPSKRNTASSTAPTTPAAAKSEARKSGARKSGAGNSSVRNLDATGQFACGHCDRTFFDEADRDRHSHVHNGERTLFYKVLKNTEKLNWATSQILIYFIVTKPNKTGFRREMPRLRRPHPTSRSSFPGKISGWAVQFIKKISSITPSVIPGRVLAFTAALFLCNARIATKSYSFSASCALTRPGIQVDQILSSVF